LNCRPGGTDGGVAVAAGFFNGKEVRGMPGFDGSGPRGEGPMSGRGQGRCGTRAGNRRIGMDGRGAGRGTGRGMGRTAGSGFFRRGLNAMFGRRGTRYGS